MGDIEVNPTLIIISERDRTYYAALALVKQVDRDLIKGTGNYRTKAGALLTTLNEVVQAILNNDLLLPEDEPDRSRHFKMAA